MVTWGRVCFSAAGGFDSGCSFLAARLNRLVWGEAGRVEAMVAWGRVCFSVAGGFDSGCSFLAARLNRLQGREVG